MNCFALPFSWRLRKRRATERPKWFCRISQGGIHCERKAGRKKKLLAHNESAASSEVPKKKSFLLLIKFITVLVIVFQRCLKLLRKFCSRDFEQPSNNRKLLLIIIISFTRPSICTIDERELSAQCTRKESQVDGKKWIMKGYTGDGVII